MLEKPDFEKKQLVFMFSSRGEKVSFKNDNILVTDKEGKIKFQTTCYRVFALYIVGETSITTGLINRAKRFGFVIYLMNRSFKLYSVIGNRMEGNTLLHRKQYEYNSNDLAKFIVTNKIKNQYVALKKIRIKNEICKEAIDSLSQKICTLKNEECGISTLLGIEGTAARIYFNAMFSNVKWNGRKPRIKNDYINSTLDIGYNMLFNFIDSLLQLYGFDLYCGIYHKEYYMRKSLVCDLMEPMRPIIDYQIRKSINLEQISEKDFMIINNQYVVEYKQSSKYVEIFMNILLENKIEMFYFIQSYYRNFMKGNTIDKYLMFTGK